MAEFDRSTLNAVTALIRERFVNSETVVNLRPVGVGANVAVHLKAETDTGQAYGLKASTRVENAIQKEVAVSGLCEVLGAPNLCKTINVQGVKIPSINFKSFNITKWLSPSLALKFIPRQDIQRNIQSFAGQFGEWMMCGLYFGLLDRHEENWVYDSNGGRLAMIDFEDAFGANVSVSQYFPLLLGYVDMAVLRSGGWTASPFKEFCAGIEKIIGGFAAQQSQVRAIMSRHSFSERYNNRFHGADLIAVQRECGAVINLL